MPTRTWRSFSSKVRQTRLGRLRADRCARTSLTRSSAKLRPFGQSHLAQAAEAGRRPQDQCRCGAKSGGRRCDASRSRASGARPGRYRSVDELGRVLGRAALLCETKRGKTLSIGPEGTNLRFRTRTRGGVPRTGVQQEGSGHRGPPVGFRLPARRVLASQLSPRRHHIIISIISRDVAQRCSSEASEPAFALCFDA